MGFGEPVRQQRSSLGNLSASQVLALPPLVTSSQRTQLCCRTYGGEGKGGQAFLALKALFTAIVLPVACVAHSGDCGAESKCEMGAGHWLPAHRQLWQRGRALRSWIQPCLKLSWVMLLGKPMKPHFNLSSSELVSQITMSQNLEEGGEVFCKNVTKMSFTDGAGVDRTTLLPGVGSDIGSIWVPMSGVSPWPSHLLGLAASKGLIPHEASCFSDTTENLAHQ